MSNHDCTRMYMYLCKFLINLHLISFVWILISGKYKTSYISDATSETFVGGIVLFLCMGLLYLVTSVIRHNEDDIIQLQEVNMATTTNTAVQALDVWKLLHDYVIQPSKDAGSLAARLDESESLRDGTALLIPYIASQAFLAMIRKRGTLEFGGFTSIVDDVAFPFVLWANFVTRIWICGLFAYHLTGPFPFVALAGPAYGITVGAYLAILREDSLLYAEAMTPMYAAERIAIFSHFTILFTTLCMLIVAVGRRVVDGCDDHPAIAPLDGAEIDVSGIDIDNSPPHGATAVALQKILKILREPSCAISNACSFHAMLMTYHFVILIMILSDKNNFKILPIIAESSSGPSGFPAWYTKRACIDLMVSIVLSICFCCWYLRKHAKNKSLQK